MILLVFSMFQLQNVLFLNFELVKESRRPILKFSTLLLDLKDHFSWGLCLEVLQPAGERVHLGLEPVLYLLAVVRHPVDTPLDVLQRLLSCAEWA